MSMFPMPYGQVLHRLRRRMVPDEYSQELTQADWSDPDVLHIDGAAIAPGSSTATRSLGRTTVSTGMSLYAPHGVDVVPEDRIQTDTGIWRVTGQVANWTNPFTGWTPGAEFNVERVEG